MPQSLSGRIALVTGADRGIGAGIARFFVEHGIRVCRNVLELPEEAASGVDESGSMTVQADIRDARQVESMFEKVGRVFGKLDILVNNAGVESCLPAIDLPIEEWDRVLDTNLRGAFLCSQGAARLMRQNAAGGVILNISSIHDEIPRLGTVHYCASKAGLTMMTKSLALEWAEFNIRVIAIQPGIVETEINREAIARFGRQRFVDWVPLKQLGTVDDIAKTALFLASDDAKYISGATLLVDGGYRLSTIQYDPRESNA